MALLLTEGCVKEIYFANPISVFEQPKQSSSLRQPFARVHHKKWSPVLSNFVTEMTILMWEQWHWYLLRQEFVPLRIRGRWCDTQWKPKWAIEFPRWSERQYKQVLAAFGTFKVLNANVRLDWFKAKPSSCEGTTGWDRWILVTWVVVSQRKKCLRAYRRFNRHPRDIWLSIKDRIYVEAMGSVLLY